MEENYRRLQSEMLHSDELNKTQLSQLQIRVDELTRELASSEHHLLEASEKLNHLQLKQQQQHRKQDEEAHQTNLKTTVTRLKGYQTGAGWLKARGQQHGQQQVVCNLEPPLLLSLQHVRHQMALNQQTLSLKLLNQSKQIQRKLNELELKVDRIQDDGSWRRSWQTNAQSNASVNVEIGLLNGVTAMEENVVGKLEEADKCLPVKSTETTNS